LSDSLGNTGAPAENKLSWDKIQKQTAENFEHLTVMTQTAVANGAELIEASGAVASAAISDVKTNWEQSAAKANLDASVQQVASSWENEVEKIPSTIETIQDNVRRATVKLASDVNRGSAQIGLPLLGPLTPVPGDSLQGLRDEVEEYARFLDATRGDATFFRESAEAMRKMDPSRFEKQNDVFATGQTDEESVINKALSAYCACHEDLSPALSRVLEMLDKLDATVNEQQSLVDEVRSDFAERDRAYHTEDPEFENHTLYCGRSVRACTDRRKTAVPLLLSQLLSAQSAMFECAASFRRSFCL
jgi:hypothetical protein